MRCNEFNDDLLDQIIYRGEGNSSIVVAIKSRAKVIRLLKKDGKIMRTSQHHHATQHPMRSIKFIHLIMKPLTAPYLSDETELIHLKSNFINSLSKKVEVERPLHRFDKTLVLDDQFALVMDDLCTLPKHLMRGFEERDFLGPTISVEIKPKQGFLLPVHRSLMRSCDNDDIDTNLKQSCLYGMNQHLKLARGRIKEESGYCPINLFSGCPAKMKSALEALMKNPQNNLRVFRDLSLFYDEGSHLVLSNLFDDSYSQNSRASTDDKERLIRILIRCLLSEPTVGNRTSGVDKIKMDYRKGDSENIFSSSSGGDICEQHSSGVSCRWCDSNLTSKNNQFNLDVGIKRHQLPKACVLASVLKAQRLDSIGAFEARYMLEWLLEHSENNGDRVDVLEELSVPQVPPGFGNPRQLPLESKRDYYFRKVWEFLVSLTAKDCSIIITIRRIAAGREKILLRQRPEIINNLVLDEETEDQFLFSVGIADLDQKMPLKIPRICDNLVSMMTKTKELGANCGRRSSLNAQ